MTWLFQLIELVAVCGLIGLGVGLIIFMIGNPIKTVKEAYRILRKLYQVYREHQQRQRPKQP